MTKRPVNPYKKILDDAKKSLGRDFPDTKFIDKMPSKERVFEPEFPYGKPMKRESGWI